MSHDLARLAASEAAPLERAPGIEHPQVHQAQRLVFEDERIIGSRFRTSLPSPALPRRADRPAIKTGGVVARSAPRAALRLLEGADVHHDYQEGGVILSCDGRGRTR